MDCVTRETAGRGAQHKATAVLARDVALEPALLPDKGEGADQGSSDDGRDGETDRIFGLAKKMIWPKK